jgi:hypothetical protein
MHAENGVIDDNAECKKVEHVGEIMPDCWRAVFARTLQIEAVRLRACQRLEGWCGASIRFPFSAPSLTPGSSSFGVYHAHANAGQIRTGCCLRVLF